MPIGGDREPFENPIPVEELIIRPAGLDAYRIDFKTVDTHHRLGGRKRQLVASGIGSAKHQCRQDRHDPERSKPLSRSEHTPSTRRDGCIFKHERRKYARQSPLPHHPRERTKGEGSDLMQTGKTVRPNREQTNEPSPQVLSRKRCGRGWLLQGFADRFLASDCPPDPRKRQ